ncbi:MAG: hypothetical protein HC812_18485 [Leptolyngbya sp. RL_3_1]|nr:hypothetical protein [Leptolyngbya sp. RL_3_1]
MLRPSNLFSNLITGLFGIITALSAILGISSLGNADRTALQPSKPLSQEADAPPDATPNAGAESLTAQDLLTPSAPRQMDQSLTQSPATAPSDTAIADSAAGAAGQNPTADFFLQGEGAVLSDEPAPPATPSEAVAVQLDPSPGTPSASATVASPDPVVQAPAAEPEPAPRTQPVRAMW